MNTVEEELSYRRTMTLSAANSCEMDGFRMFEAF